MSTIEKMTDQEKSVFLAKAMGKPLWIIRLDVSMMGIEDSTISNLYDPANMSLAWMCLNWASERDDDIDDYSYPYYYAQGVEELFDTDVEIKDQIWAMSPAVAQCLWLDKILELAIEAGLVELEEEKE